MSAILVALQAKRRLLAGEGVSMKEVRKAENELGLSFSKEYKDYLQAYGIAAYGGHELTGLSKSPRTNVVTVTKLEREKNPSISEDLYVIEQTNVEEVVVWQSTKGAIYYSSPNNPLTKLCDSLTDYIEKH